MADASPETIQRLIGNSEKGLAQIEVSLLLILKTRQVVEEAIKNHDGSNVVLDLILVVLDTILAENEVTYDLSASLNALLKADNDYTKRYYMQSLNLCFWESCQVFVGEDGDEYGLLSNIEVLTKQLFQAGSQLIAKHIIDDIQEFRKEYADKELRNITRHYDDPIKMYEKQQKLTNIDYFAKGASQLIAIRMEVMVVSSYLLRLLNSLALKKQPQNDVAPSRKSFSEIVNDTLFKTFKEKGLENEIQRVLEKGQSSLDECYSQYNMCCRAVRFLEEKNLQIPDSFKKLESLIRLRMEVLFLKNDVACSIWGYINASTDMERSQNLRQIHITKQAALTHIYGYNEKARRDSLWAKIMEIEESIIKKFDTKRVEQMLEELTGNLADDRINSNIFAHYRHQQEFYVPARLEAFDKMLHHKEMYDAMKLFEVCKALDGYTVVLLSCIHENQKQETKRQRDEWICRIDDLIAKVGNDERAKEALKPLREFIDMVYPDEFGSN